MIQSKNIERKPAGDTAARIISDIVNPLTLPLLVFGVAGMASDASLKSITEILGATALLFLFIPLLAAITIVKVNGGATLDFRSRPDRSALYVVSVVSIGLGGLLLFDEIFTKMYRVILIIYLANLVIALGINFKWKASVHVGSAVTASVLLSWLGTFDAAGVWLPFATFIIIIFLPVVAWARIQLRVHSRFEILLGGVTGLISTGVMILFLA